MATFKKNLLNASLSATLVLSAVGVAALPVAASAGTVNVSTSPEIDNALNKLVNELKLLHTQLAASPSDLAIVQQSLDLARNASQQDWTTIVYGDTQSKMTNPQLVTAIQDLFTLTYSGAISDDDSLNAEIEQVKADLQSIDPSITGTDVYHFYENFVGSVETSALSALLGTDTDLNVTDIVSKALQDAANNTTNANGDQVFVGLLTDNGLQVSDLVAIKDRASLAFDPTNASRLALIKAEASTKLKKQVYTALTTGNYMNYHLTVSKPDSAFDGLQVPSSLVTWVSSDPTVASFGTGSNAGKLTANKKGSTTVSAVVKGYTLQSFTVTVATANNGGGGGGGDVITPTPAPTPSIPVPNGSTIVTPQTTTTVETDANGNKINVVKVDEAALLGQLTQGSDSKAVVISADTNGGTAKVELSLDLLTKAAANNSGNTFIIQINGAAYELPASLVSSDSIAKALNLSAADAAGATISIVTSEQPQSVTSQVEAATGGHSVAKVIDFSIVVTKGDQSATLNNFGSTYVNRAFDLTGTVDGKQAVGVIVNSDGTVAPVPTEFVQVGDKKVAVLKRNGNSTYTVLTHDVQFADIDKSWAKADIKLLADKMIITGYSDGNFHPTENVTRGQFATLLARGLGLSKSTNTVKFTDVANNAFYAGYVQALADAGIVNGYSDGTYKGGDNISRQDTIILLSKAVEFLKLRGDLSDADAAQAIQKFKDIDKVGGYAKTAVGITTGLHLISGDDQGHLNPTNNTSRAETVIMIEKLLNLAKFL